MCFVLKIRNLNVVAGIAFRQESYNLQCRNSLQNTWKRASHL